MPDQPTAAAVLRLLVLACCLALTACSGSRSGSSAVLSPQAAVLRPAPASPGLAGQLPGLPEDAFLHPRRRVAAAEAQLLGKDFTSASAGLGTNLHYAQLGSGPTQVAWALYQFGGAPGETITGCRYTVTGLGPTEKVYCAIADYGAGRWSFLPLSTSTTASFTLPAGNYQSGLGNSWLLVATYGGDSVSLDSVGLTYSARFTISGTVRDKDGNGVPGVAVTTGYAGLTVLTDASGNYSLGGLPDDSYAVVAALDGWTTYPAPQLITLGGTDAPLIDFVADPHGSRFTAGDLQPNNNRMSAPVWDTSQMLGETLSADDDPRDCFRITVNEPGTYYVYFRNPAMDMFFPIVSVLHTDPPAAVDSTSILNGNCGAVFTVTSAPREFFVEAGCSLGGGRYTLELRKQQPRRIFVRVEDNNAVPAAVRLAMLTLTATDSGESTRYATSASFPGPLYGCFDNCVPPVEVTLSASFGGYTMAPPSSLVDLAAGDSMSVVFTATPPVTADTGEPNDTAATAYPLPALPYDSEAAGEPLQVSAIAGGDAVDYYSFTPPAGMGITAELERIGGQTGFDPPQVIILNSAEAQISTPFISADRKPGVMRTLTNTLTDGNICYVRVLPAPGNQLESYRLRIRTYPAHQLQFGAALPGGTPLMDSGRFFIYEPGFDFRYALSVNPANGLTQVLLVEDGSQWMVEYDRFGLAEDEQTFAFTMPVADTVHTINLAGQGLDSHEPDGSLASIPAQALAVPFQFDASLSSTSDPLDAYQLAPGDGRPFHVKVQVVGGGPARLQLAGLNSIGVVTYAPIGTVSTTEFNLPNDGNPGQVLALLTSGLCEARYHVEVSNIEAYSISGVITDTLAAPVGAVVKNLTTGENALNVNTSYSLPPVVPGTYQIACYQSGYDPVPNIATVTVTNANVVYDFTNLAAFNRDAYEPNNSEATAYPIASGFNYFATVGITDPPDYYRLPLTAGQTVELELQLGDNYMSYGIFGVFEPFTGSLIPAARLGDGYYVLSYTMPSTGDLLFVVSGYMSYRLRANVF